MYDTAAAVPGEETTSSNAFRKAKVWGVLLADQASATRSTPEQGALGDTLRS